MDDRLRRGCPLVLGEGFDGQGPRNPMLLLVGTVRQRIAVPKRVPPNEKVAQRRRL